MHIGAFEAKTHFSQVIAEVERGQDYIVAKRGKPVVKNTPVPEENKSFGEAILEMRDYVKRHWKGDEPFDIRAAIEEGRR
jgi:prevent-host-death family protein